MRLLLDPVREDMDYSFPYYHQPAHTQFSTLDTTSFLLSTTQEVEAKTLVEKPLLIFSRMGVCVCVCNFNIPGVDHKMLLPDVPGKWPWSRLPLPGQSAIPLAEVREKKGVERAAA